MKYLFSFVLSCVFVLPAISRNTDNGTPAKGCKPAISLKVMKSNKAMINISAVEFKNQKFCRAEPDETFDFDVHFTVVSADVYFSGANFQAATVKGAISSSSLEPVKKYMDRCTPGTIVVFDNIKVMGPDNKVRTIRGEHYTLF